MKIGARNCLEGEVQQIKRGSVMEQVKLKIKADTNMESVMALDSLDELGIEERGKSRP